MVIPLPDGKIVQQNKNIFRYADRNIEYDGKYTKNQTEILDTNITFTGSTTQSYYILPTGKYYQCHSCVMQIDLTGQFKQTTKITLQVGWNIIDVIQNKSISELINTYWMTPLLSDRDSHMMFSSNRNTYIDTDLPIYCDLRATNTPFRLKCNEAISINAHIVFWYV